MRHLAKYAVIALAVTGSLQASAQIYTKLNLLYAAVGVINPQFEFTVSPHSTISMDLTYSPWKSINGHHMNFGIFQGEYRYYFRGSNNGWYLSGNFGLTGFDISKPQLFKDGFISFKDGWSKGFGAMIGVGFGYEHVFRERWVVDAFFAFDFVHSWYNGYNSDGSIIMNPQGHEEYEHPDPFNCSSEWMPVKIGVSVGYRIFNPDRRR